MRYLVIYDSNSSLLHMICDDSSCKNGEQAFVKFIDDPDNKGITFRNGEPFVNDDSDFLDNLAPEEEQEAPIEGEFKELPKEEEE